MGLDKPAFYDATKIAFAPSGFCFPGNDAKGGDLPPRKECMPLWRDRLMAHLHTISLTLLVGGYAQTIALGKSAHRNVTQTVMNWRDYAPKVFVLPHPSWRNTAWITKNPWFEAEVLPALQEAVAHARSS
jgi:uracil-DNA glycosylase